MHNPFKQKEYLSKSRFWQLAQKQPAFWMKHGCGWDLWEMQEEIAKALVKYDRISVPASFGVGKTYLGARLALWFLYNHYPSKVITTAPTARQVERLMWSEIRTAHATSIRKLGGTCLTKKLELDANWFAEGFTTNEDNIDRFTGYHSENILVVFDQACGISRSVWEATEGLMAGGNAKWLCLSNTTVLNSEFAKTCIENYKSDFGKWEVFPIPVWITPNIKEKKNIVPGLVSWKWVQEKTETWGVDNPLYRIMLNAEFVDEIELYLFTEEMLEHAFSDDDKLFNFEDIQIGLDIAEKGGDSSVWSVRAGKRIYMYKEEKGLNTMQVVDVTVELLRRLENFSKSITVAVDVIGIGSGVGSRLQELGVQVIPVNVAEKPTTIMPGYDADNVFEFFRPANIKAQLAWYLHNLLEKKPLVSFLPKISKNFNKDKLKEEFRFKFIVLDNGTVRCEKKIDVRKRIGRSPDHYDAVALSFFGTDFTEQAEPIFNIDEDTKSNIKKIDDNLHDFLYND